MNIEMKELKHTQLLIEKTPDGKYLIENDLNSTFLDDFKSLIKFIKSLHKKGVM